LVKVEKKNQGVQHRDSHEPGDPQPSRPQAMRDRDSQQAAASASFNTLPPKELSGKTSDLTET
jgi:hypothetical protein